MGHLTRERRLAENQAGRSRRVAKRVDRTEAEAGADESLPGAGEAEATHIGYVEEIAGRRRSREEYLGRESVPVEPPNDPEVIPFPPPSPLSA